jgi:hypothetical protein
MQSLEIFGVPEVPFSYFACLNWFDIWKNFSQLFIGWPTAIVLAHLCLVLA